MMHPKKSYKPVVRAFSVYKSCTVCVVLWVWVAILCRFLALVISSARDSLLRLTWESWAGLDCVLSGGGCFCKRMLDLRKTWHSWHLTFDSLARMWEHLVLLIFPSTIDLWESTWYKETCSFLSAVLIIVGSFIPGQTLSLQLFWVPFVVQF